MNVDMTERRREQNRINSKKHRDKQKLESEGLKCDIEALTNDNQALKQDNKALKAENTRTNKMVATLQKEKEALTQEKEALEKEKEVLEKEKAALKQEKEAIQTQHEREISELKAVLSRGAGGGAPEQVSSSLRLGRARFLSRAWRARGTPRVREPDLLSSELGHLKLAAAEEILGKSYASYP